MISTERIPKTQLQVGILDAIQVTSITLTVGGWSLVSGFYEYNYSNANILSTSIIDIIPEKGSLSIFKSAGVLPSTLSSSGSVKLYAANLPIGSIIVTINIFN